MNKFFGGGESNQSPPPPTPAPPPPTVDDAAAKAQEKAKADSLARQSQGRASTILTSGQGDTTSPIVKKKTLLGE